MKCYTASMLNLYRRHEKADRCLGHHKPNSASYETDELRRGHKHCVCPIYASGTLGGHFSRKNTGQHEWEAAKIVAQGWQTAGSWEGTPPAPPPLPTEPAHRDPSRVTLDDAATKYLKAHERNKTAELTVESYQERLRDLKKFATARGYCWIDQWIGKDVRDLQDTWDNAQITRYRKLIWVRTFFNYCKSQEWITTNPTDTLVHKGIGKSSAQRMRKQKSPFSDAEIRRIIAACHRLPVTAWRNGASEGEWSGQDVADFITVLIFTGLRISDVAQFDISRLRGNMVFLRQHKTKKPLLTAVNNEVRDMLLARAELHGPKIFQQFSLFTDSAKRMTAPWRRKIKLATDIAAQEQAFTSAPTPHRFRHTFVRILLQQKVSISIVAELAGDTEAVIREHYAEWCDERQELVAETMSAVFNGPDYTKWCRDLLGKERPQLRIVKPRRSA